jgi:hypothetical protein
MGLDRRWQTALWMLTLWLAAAGTGGAATRSDDLDAAKAFYHEGRFVEAIERLRAAVGELTLLRDLELRRVQLADAYLHLGLAHLALQQKDEAREAFREMLRADPARRLDPDTYAPKVMALYQEARASLPSRAAADAAGGAAPRAERRSRLPLVLGGVGVAAGGAVALAARGESGPPSVNLRCEPNTLSLEQTTVTSVCTATAGEGKGEVRLSLECSALPAGVPCRLEPASVTLAPGRSATSSLVVDPAFTARAGSYAFQVKGSAGGADSAASLQLQVGPTCSGFSERPSDPPGCSDRAPNVICWGFQDGYVWRADDSFGAPGYTLGPCQGRTVQVARGGRADYHHVLGTLYVKTTSPSRP